MEKRAPTADDVSVAFEIVRLMMDHDPEQAKLLAQQAGKVYQAWYRSLDLGEDS
jgi:hypothetical protein